MMPSSLFLFAGEASGDLHGAALIQKMRYLAPTLHIFGVGGPLMRKAGLSTLMPMESFQVMGFIDVFCALPRLICHFYRLRKEILSQKPSIALFIDYPGFSLRLERSLHKKGFQGKLVHYISPSVWAWGKKRIPQMESTLDLLLTIFPFERKYFSSSFPVVYVGHPLVMKNRTHPSLTWAHDKKVISLFPGSRKKEILRNLPLQLRVLNTLLLEHPEAIGAISVSDPSLYALIASFVHEPHIRLVQSTETQALMQHSFLAIAKSGTVTLELALYNIPMVVTYVLSRIDLWIARDLLRIRLPFYCIVNIAAEQLIVSELIGPHATYERLLHEARALFDPCQRMKQQHAYQILQERLGTQDASLHAAQVLLQGVVNFN